MDLIAGYSTEGRIKAYNFQIPEDDKHFFPPYYACPVIRGETLRRYPFLKDIFAKIEGKISNKKMQEMNYKVEYENQSPKDVARDFLVEVGLKPTSTTTHTSTKTDIIIGSKNFTEQYILAEIFKQLIEDSTSLKVHLKTGLAGTKFCFDALVKGDIDIYPEYTGTALFVILKPGRDAINCTTLLQNNDKLYSYVNNESRNRFDITWLGNLGFNNTWTLIMRKNDTDKLMIKTISNLKDYID